MQLNCNQLCNYLVPVEHYYKVLSSIFFKECFSLSLLAQAPPVHPSLEAFPTGIVKLLSLSAGQSHTLTKQSCHSDLWHTLINNHLTLPYDITPSCPATCVCGVGAKEPRKRGSAGDWDSSVLKLSLVIA